MKGSYTVKIHNRRVTFTIQLDRNITVICGDSATGKTTLINSIMFYEELGEKSGVTIESVKDCRVLHGKNWFEDLQKISDSFVFIDEGNEFISSQEFAVAIQNTDNYYVFVTRENLYQIPYSVNSILELRKTTSRFKHTYNRSYPMYDKVDSFMRDKYDVDTFITEDSNSGHDLFSYLADKNGIRCISAKGKDKILTKLSDFIDDKSLVIADGAAFGANMAEVYSYVKRHPENVFLYLPESFEWLLLASDIINDKEVKEILNNPADYIESKNFFSWEQFFTDLLVRKTRGTVAKYNKKKLAKYYLQDKNIEKIVKTIRNGESHS